MNNVTWAAYSKWQDPPDVHEVCKCEECCEAGEHDKIEEWAKAECEICFERLQLAVANNEFCLIHHVWYCEKELVN